ncbi:hypothetical protein, partial [Sphingobacterium sp. UBA5789]
SSATLMLAPELVIKGFYRTILLSFLRRDPGLPGERLRTAIPTAYFYTLLTAKELYCWLRQ